MLGRHKTLLVISAVFLISILFGMVPLKMAHRLASGGPFTDCKQAQCGNHSPFNSLVSHNDSTIVNLNLTPLDQKSAPAFDIQVLDPDTIHSNATIHSVPLRC
jgi:hypothetical protein